MEIDHRERALRPHHEILRLIVPVDEPVRHRFDLAHDRREGLPKRCGLSGIEWTKQRLEPPLPKVIELPVEQLAIEAALRLDFPGRKMALLGIDGEVLMVIEGEVPAGFESKVAELGATRVLSLENLPMDRRHQSKIDYPALRVAVEGLKRRRD